MHQPLERLIGRQTADNYMNILFYIYIYRLVSRLWIYIYILASQVPGACAAWVGLHCINQKNIYNQCISWFFQQNTISTKTFAMQSHCGMVSSLGFSKPIWPEWGGFSKPGWWLFQAPLQVVLFQAHGPCSTGGSWGMPPLHQQRFHTHHQP